MNRREFMTWAGAGFLATSLPVALAACSTPTATTPLALPVANAGTNGYATVANLADLRLDSAIEALGPDKKPIAITGDIQKPESIVAVNPTCTHKGCVVKWNASDKQFVCPCHGASFDNRGQVTKGPASKPLPTYAVKVENGKILVKV